MSCGVVKWRFIFFFKKKELLRNIVYCFIVSTKDGAFPTLAVGTEPGHIMNYNNKNNFH